MTNICHEFYAAHNTHGWRCAVLSGRDGLRAFLRLHQHAQYPAPALHYRDVNDMMLCGHILLGVYAPDHQRGRDALAGAAMLLFPGRPLPAHARYRENLDDCAVLQFVSTSRDAHAFTRSKARAMLVEAACRVAHRNGRRAVLDAYAGAAKPGRAWDAATGLSTSLAKIKIDTAGPYAPILTA